MNKIISFLLLLLLSFFSCKDWVQNTDPYIDQAKDEDLDDEVELRFLIRGVQQRFATSYDQLGVLASGLSDELFFSYDIQGASYDSFYDIDRGDILSDNSSCSNAYDYLGEARFYADDLIRRTQSITITDTSLMYTALYTGYLYGGIARILFADIFGLTEDQGGSPINSGPFITSSALYDSAIFRFNKAMNYASSGYEVRLCNSLMARACLYQASYTNDYSNVQPYAAAGLIPGDASFEALFHNENAHAWFFYSGAGRTQFALDNRFIDYLEADSTETRIEVFGRIGWDGNVYWFQDKYPDRNSPIPYMTWQENNLMLAEMAIRNSDPGTALTLINENRKSHDDIDPLSDADLDTIIRERDIELMCTGTRLVDQRRFNIWHLPSGTWHYLPVSLDERNANPYID